MVILRCLGIFSFRLYLFGLGPWISKPARLSKLRGVGFWACSTRPVELNPLSHFSSSASTCLHVHVHVHIYLSSFPPRRLPSALLSLESFQPTVFLKFLALGSRFRYGVSPLAQTPYWFRFVPQHSSFCLCSFSLSSALSPSVVVLCDRCLVLVFIIILNRNSSPLCSSPTHFIHSSTSLSSHFFFMHANYCFPSYIQKNGERNRPPPVQPPRPVNVIQIMFIFVLETGSEVHVVLFCLFSVEAERSSQTSNI